MLAKRPAASLDAAKIKIVLKCNYDAVHEYAVRSAAGMQSGMESLHPEMKPNVDALIADTSTSAKMPRVALGLALGLAHWGPPSSEFVADSHQISGAPHLGSRAQISGTPLEDPNRAGHP